MKNKIIFVSLVLLLSLSICYAQIFDISIEYNSNTHEFLPVCFWIKNNTGEDIPNVEYILNDNYFYSSDLPVSGCTLNLLDFAKQDGTRYDYFSIKPIELKVKSKKGIYSIKFDDIPYKKDVLSQYSQIINAFIEAIMADNKKDIPSPFPVGEEYRSRREPLQYSKVIETLTIHTMDALPAFVIVQVAFGYSDKVTAQEISARKIEITDFLRFYFQSKTVSELKQEAKIKIEIRNKINDNILTASRIQDVRFTKYEIIEP